MNSLAFLLDTTLKGTVLLLLSGALNLALRRASAAARHLVWSLGLGAMLALPLLSLMLPAWKAPVTLTSPSGITDERTVTKEGFAPVPRKHQFNTEHLAQASTPAVGTSSYPRYANWILSLWAIGSIILVARIALGEGRVRRVARRSQTFKTRQATCTLENVRSLLRLSRAVELRTSTETAIPFTRGALRPIMVLPAEARQWSEKQLEWVLGHELAHVYRNDYLTQMAAQFACALFWFHPLVWLASFAMRKERERACDDMVLSLGHPATDYAEFLLLLSRGLRRTNGAWLTGLAMAQSSQLEVRMKALLDPQLNHRPLPASRALLSVALALALVLPVAAIRVAAKNPSGNISGTVRDPSGAVIPDARITLVNTGLNSKIEGQTGGDGTFKFEAIPPGSYRLEITSPGFVYTKTSDLDLEPSGDLRQDITMNIEEVLEEVVVHGRKPAGNPPEAPPVPRRIHVGGNVQAAKLISRVEPEYPDEAQQQGIEGTVILRAVIGMNGRILSLKADNDADPVLATAAMEAVRQWRYWPTLLNGEPIEVVTTITVGFRLDE